MRRIAVVVPLLILLAGCGAGGESGGSANTAMSASDGAKSAAGGGEAAPPAALAAQPAIDKAAKPVAVPRSLIRTAELVVRVDHVKQATAAAEQLVEDAGGEVSD